MHRGLSILTCLNFETDFYCQTNLKACVLTHGYNLALYEFWNQGNFPSIKVGAIFQNLLIPHYQIISLDSFLEEENFEAEDETGLLPI